MKNNTSKCIATVMLALFAALPVTALADKTMEVKMRFAGSFTNAVLRADPFDPFGPPVPSAMIDVKTRGSLGKGVLQGGGGRGTTVEVPVFECLGSPGTFLKAIPTEDPLVATFEDLSLLFMTGPGVICVDLVTGKGVFKFEVMFTGGRKRFAGATGYAVIEGEAEPVSADGSFSGETGTVKGWVTVPSGNDHDDDSDSDSD